MTEHQTRGMRGVPLFHGMRVAGAFRLSASHDIDMMLVASHFLMLHCTATCNEAAAYVRKCVKPAGA